MTRRTAYLGLAGLAVLGLAAGYAGLQATGQPPEPEVQTQEDCDSCTARKKDMARMRDRLTAPDQAGE